VSKLSAEQIKNLVNGIVGCCYREDNSEISLDSAPLPNRKAVIEVTALLRELLFPEYFGQHNLISTTAEYHIGDLLINIQEKLHEQILYALHHQTANEGNEADICAQADAIIYNFFKKVPQLRRQIELDVEAAFDGDPAAVDKDEIIFSYPGVFAISIYRMAHELHSLSVPLIPRIMTEYAHSVTGIDIHPGAAIGNYFFIDHGTGIVIGETTIIGNRVKIYQGVTLGALSPREGQNLRGVKRHPTIEDGVTIYSGTSILGGETIIGKGVVIGSNVFLTRSVPAGTKVSIKVPELVFKGNPDQEAEPDCMELDI
jgi:serine O-acetyltransferase